MNENSSIVKDSLIYLIPTSISTLLTPLSLFFYTKILTPDDYGVIGLISVTAGLFLILSNWGLVNGLVRFYEENEKGNLDALAGTAYWGSCLSGLIFFIVYYVSSPLLSDKILGEGFRHIYILGGFTILFNMAYQACQNLLRIQKKVYTYVIFDTVKITLSIFSGIFLVYCLKMGLYGFYLASLLVQGMMCVIQFAFLWKNYSLVFSRTYFKKMFRYGAPFVIIIIGGWLLDFSDRYILNLFVPLAELGIYSMAYSFGMYIQLLVTPFITAILPYLFQYHREGTYQSRTGQIAFHYIAIYMGIILILSWLVKPYFYFFAATNFHGAISLAPWITVAYAWRGLFNLFCFCNTLTGNAKMQFVIEISASVLNIILNFLLIPVIGVYGAVLSTIFAWLYMLFFAYWFNQSVMPLDLHVKKVGWILLAWLPCFAAILTLNQFSGTWLLGSAFLIGYGFFLHFYIHSLNPKKLMSYIFK
jgi:O-antigen/teichoic acid export membrane protein